MHKSGTMPGQTVLSSIEAEMPDVVIDTETEAFSRQNVSITVCRRKESKYQDAIEHLHFIVGCYTLWSVTDSFYL